MTINRGLMKEMSHLDDVLDIFAEAHSMCDAAHLTQEMAALVVKVFISLPG